MLSRQHLLIRLRWFVDARLSFDGARRIDAPQCDSNSTLKLLVDGVAWEWPSEYDETHSDVVYQVMVLERLIRRYDERQT